MANMYGRLCNRHFSGDIGVEGPSKMVDVLGGEMGDAVYLLLIGLTMLHLTTPTSFP